MAVPAPACAESNNSRADRQPAVQRCRGKAVSRAVPDFDCMAGNGFPNDDKCHAFLDGLTHVLTAETAHNHELIAEANRRGTESYIQPNFCEYLIKNDLPLPTKFLAPCSWNIDALRQRFGDRVVLLPPPTMPEDFARARQANIGRKGRRRFLHIIGKPAAVPGRIQPIGLRSGPSVPERRRRRLPQMWDQKSHPWRYRAPQRTRPPWASVALWRTPENLPRSPRCRWHVSLRGFRSGHAQ
jgi:hypothetical protein